MRKRQKSMLALAVMTAFMATGLFLPVLIDAGELEPSGPPGPTMKTLQDIYDKLDAITRDIFEVKTGFPGHCKQIRFCDLGDGTVLDTETGLIWLKNANCFGTKNWYDATAAAATLNAGECGLTDGSSEDDWRLPTKEELEGIGTDPPTTWYEGYPQVTWAMPGSPFENVQSYHYWSSTQYDPNYAWIGIMGSGCVFDSHKTWDYYVWPVRPGNW